jgi:hypothetical protein
MSQREFCKGCLETVIVSEEVIEELEKEAEEDLSIIVSADMYELRLQICQSCPALKYGTTCAHSGSIVRYRAKFKNKSCPMPGKARWEKEDL